METTLHPSRLGYRLYPAIVLSSALIGWTSTGYTTDAQVTFHPPDRHPASFLELTSPVTTCPEQKRELIFDSSTLACQGDERQDPSWTLAGSR